MMSSEAPNLSSRIAAHVAASEASTMPAASLTAARRALLDALGVMLGATGLSPEAAPYREVAASGGTGPCRLLGSRHRTGPIGAAFANAALAHALDYGDTFDAGPAHPHAALVPALLALADLLPELTLSDFLAALAIGSDLACRLSLAPAQPFEAAGWYPPPLVNLVSSAAACAKVLELRASGIRDAMGLGLLAAAFPAILKHDRHSPLRGLREAFAARGAVEAALLARAGAESFSDPLAGKGGFFDVYGGGYRTGPLLDGLGERYLGTQVSFKPWPACRGTHAYIEAALELRQDIDLGCIAGIEVGIGPIQEMLMQPLGEEPSAIQAKFSIPYTVATALIEGRVDLDSFDEMHRRDPAIAELAAKVDARRVAGWGREHAASGILHLILGDGRMVVAEVPSALGSLERPLSNDALVAKFVDCARRGAPALATTTAETVALGILTAAGDSPVAEVLVALCDRQEAA